MVVGGRRMIGWGRSSGSGSVLELRQLQGSPSVLSRTRSRSIVGGSLRISPSWGSDKRSESKHPYGGVVRIGVPYLTRLPHTITSDNSHENPRASPKESPQGERKGQTIWHCGSSYRRSASPSSISGNARLIYGVPGGIRGRSYCTVEGWWATPSRQPEDHPYD